MSEKSRKEGTATSRIDGPLKWHIDGGKAYLASRIVSLMPPKGSYINYVEAYAGGLSVLLEMDPEGVSEVVNDLNKDLTNFWRVLACEVQFPRFQKIMQATPFSEEAWQDAHCVVNEAACNDEAYLAAYFFVLCRQSLSGRMKEFAGLTKTRTRRGMNEQVSAWLSAVDGLPEVHARLRRVLILNRAALDVIREFDGPQTLFYLDPPYLHETRATTGEYQHEMSYEDHQRLLAALVAAKGKWLLSGYRSDLYDGWAELNGFPRHEFDLPNNSAGGKTKQRRTECVWANYDAPEAKP